MRNTSALLGLSVAGIAAAACNPSAGGAQGVTFSVAPGSLGLPGTAVETAGTPAHSDLFRSEGRGSHDSPGTNALAAPAGPLGLADGDPLDAVSLRKTGSGATRYVFSVSPASAGEAGSGVAAEASAGEAAGDVFESSGAGTSALLHDEVALGLRPLVAGGVSDDLDALDTGVLSAGSPVYFSVSAGAAGAAGSAVAGDPSPGTVFVSMQDGTNRVFVPASDLGLADADDLDALFVHDGDGDGAFDRGTDWVAFSAAPGASGLPGSALAASGAAAADVFRSDGDGTNDLLVAASGLGLLATDDLDALDILGAPGIWTPPDDGRDVPDDGGDDGWIVTEGRDGEGGEDGPGDAPDDRGDADYITTPFCGDGRRDLSTLEECDPGNPDAGLSPVPCEDPLLRCTSRCTCVEACAKRPDPAGDHLLFDPGGPSWGPTTGGADTHDLVSAGACVMTEIVNLELIGVAPMPAAPAVDSFFDVFIDCRPGGKVGGVPWAGADVRVSASYTSASGWQGSVQRWEPATALWVADGSAAVLFAPPDGSNPIMRMGVAIGTGGLAPADVAGTARFFIGSYLPSGSMVLDSSPEPDLPALPVPEW